MVAEHESHAPHLLGRSGNLLNHRVSSTNAGASPPPRAAGHKRGIHLVIFHLDTFMTTDLVGLVGHCLG